MAASIAVRLAGPLWCAAMFPAPPRPFRLGCTSFVLPDHVLPNVEWLAGKVDDIQLLLLDAHHDVPPSSAFQRMAELGRLYGLSFCVHLPDLCMGGSPSEHTLPDVARLARLAAPVNPSGFVVHTGLPPPRNGAEQAGWLNQATEALHTLSEQSGVPMKQWEVENQAAFDLLPLANLARHAGCSLCLDVGHLLREGADALAAVVDHLDITTHIHLHGVAERDHSSLEYVPGLPRLLHALVERSFTGVVTLEVFGQDVFERSVKVLQSAWGANA